MKLKKILLSGGVGLFLLSVIMFTLTSKGGPGGGNNSICSAEQKELKDASISIAFTTPGNNGYPGRNDFYEFYIPENDIRSGHQNPASSLTDGSTYYYTVKVTSPDCASVNWTGRATSENGGNGNMTIKVPKGSMKVRIRIEYYEPCANGIWAPFNTRLKYIREKTFLSTLPSNTTETFFLAPQSRISCSGSGTSGSTGGGGGSVGELLDEIMQ